MSDSMAVEVPLTGMSDRLRQVEVHARLALAARTRPAEPVDTAPDVGTPLRLIPVPRRARMFMLRGPGFAEVVLTSPHHAARAAAAERPFTFLG